VIRRETGQTAAEYVGVLLLVAVTIATLATAGPGPQIAHELERIVCRAFGTCEIAREGATRDRADRRAGRGPTARAASALRPPPPDPPLIPKVGEVDDYGGGLTEMIFGGEPYTVMGGEIWEVKQAGVPLGPIIRTVGRALGVGKKAWQAAKARAKPLGVPTGLLLAAEKAARYQSRDLQRKLTTVEQRYKTVAVGVGKAPDGKFRLVVGSSDPNGLYPASIRGLIKKVGIPAMQPGHVHAEVRVLEWMKANGYRPITVGAGRPICPLCADAIARTGASAASRLKGR